MSEQEEYGLTDFDFESLTFFERTELMRRDRQRSEQELGELLQARYDLGNQYVQLREDIQRLRVLVGEAEGERDRLTEKLSRKRDEREENHRFDLELDL